MPDRPTPDQIKTLNERQRRYFNANVDLFEPPLPRGVAARLKATVEAAAIRPGDRLLDVGTGTGVLISYMKKYGPAEIHACDLAERMLGRVREKFPGVVTHQSDVSDLALPDGSLDAAFINGCFSNILDKDKALGNLARMLRPGGRLVVSHPLGRSFIVELKKHAPLYLDLLPGEAEAREMLGRHGFRITQFKDEAAFYLVVAEAER